MGNSQSYFYCTKLVLFLLGQGILTYTFKTIVLHYYCEKKLEYNYKLLIT